MSVDRLANSTFSILSVYFTLALLTSSMSRVCAQEQTPIRIQLKWNHQFQFAGYYAAQFKGYYDEEGLSVHLLEGDARNPPVGNVLNGKAEFGVTGADLLNEFVDNKPVTVISTIFQHSPYVFITLADSKITTATDLAGKTIMAAEDQGWLLLRAVFLKEGIAVNSIKFQQHSWNIQDLIDGKTQAITGYSTVEPNQIRKRGVNVTLIRPSDYGIDFYGDLFFTTQTIARDQPQLVERLNRAVIRGWEYAMSHPEELADYILRLPGVQQRGLTRDDLLEEAAEMQKLILPELVEIGHMNPGRWQNMLDICKQLGMAPKDASIDGFLFQPASTRKMVYFDMLAYALIVGVSLFILALIWNWQLRKTVLRKTLDLQKEIAERKSAEQRLELAIQAAGLGVWEWNLETGEATYDDDWIASLGYDSTGFRADPNNWTEMVHPEDYEQVKEVMGGLIKGQAPLHSLAYRIKTPDGNWKWILSFSKISETGEGGRASKILGTHLDIDFIKEKEQELRKITAELRKTNTELERFAYITSHNLRAPVVNLRSLTEMQADSSTPAELQEEISQKIHFCVRQLDDTLNDLIEVVASKSGKDIQKEHLNIKEEFGVVLQSIEKQIIESGAQIDMNFTEVRNIFFPRRFLHSILLNLLTNAIKYRSEKRRLHISLKTRARKDCTILYFSDNGSGMDMTKFGSKIFGLYQRFHSKIDGKGLGLYIVKSQIESQDGKIEVDSMLDVGTTFKISFQNTGAIDA